MNPSSPIIKKKSNRVLQNITKDNNNGSPALPPSSSSSDNSSKGACHEVWQLTNLAIPTFFIQLGASLPPALAAAYVGRNLGAVYLDGFTLGNTTGNLFTLSLLSGLFTASDTLSPQAFGAGNYKEVGLIAIRGFVACMMMLIPINIVLLMSMDSLLMLFGEEPEPARLAKQWYRVYVISLPFYALYQVTWKFLAAQEILRPVMYVLLLSCGVILPLTLEPLVTHAGFIGSALVIVVFQVSLSALLLLYLWWKRPHNPSTWQGLNLSTWKEAMSSTPFWTYVNLGLGGVLAASEWWYWEVVSLMIGTMGVVPLGVHTVATQVIVLGFVVPVGMQIALSVRLGSTLPRSVKRAKLITFWTYLSCIIAFGMISILIYTERRPIIHLFTNEEEIIEGCETIWWKVSFFNFQLSMFVVHIGISAGLGQQWMLGIISTVSLWVLALPALYVTSIPMGGGIDSAWTWIYISYLIMNVILVWQFSTADWGEISRKIRIREKMDEPVDSGETAAGMTSYGSLADDSATEVASTNV